MNQFYRFVRVLGLTMGLAVPAWAQKQLPPPIKFGTVSKDDMQQAAPADSAEAEVLCDFGQSKIVGAQDGFELLFERTTRLRINRKAGYEWATVRVPLYHKDGRREQLQQLKGLTYNVEPGTGKILKTPLRTEAVFSRKLTEHLDEYAFTLPEVREGSVLEFTYTVRSSFLFNLQDWQFQHTIPVRWSEYRTIVPAFFRYKEISRTYWPFAFNESTVHPYTTAYRQAKRDSFGNALNQDNSLSLTTQAVHRRWVLKNAPAFQEEAYMTTSQDYLSQVDFELERIQFQPDQAPAFVVGSWAEIEKELLKQEEFGVYLDRRTPLTEAATALRTTYPEAGARAAAVRTLVQQAVGYDGENSLYARNSAKKVCEQRHGNAAEVNLLLIRSLRDAGLDAQPLLLSTRNHGRIQTELPVLSQFNYLVAYVGGLPAGQELLLDATEPYLPAALLPERCLNGQGRLLGPAGRWLPLRASQSHLVFLQATLQLDAHGALAGTMRHEYAGYAAPAAREASADLGHNWQKTHPDWTLERHSAAPTPPEQPLALSLTARLPGAEQAAATLYVRPLQHLAASTSPFRTEERLFPVDLSAPQHTEYLVTLTLPAGYTATALPADVNMSLPNNGGRFVYSITKLTPTTLRINSRLLLEKTSYPAAEYAALRELHTRALAKLAEPLVVQKQ